MKYFKKPNISKPILLDVILWKILGFLFRSGTLLQFEILDVSME